MKALDIILRIAAVIFLAEALVMLGLRKLPAELERWETLIDATLLTISCVPVIFYWVIHPFMEQRDQAEEQLKVAGEELENKVDERTRELRQEIVERAMVEATLRKLSEAVDQSPVTVLITDAHGNIEYVNTAFEETTGYLAEDVIGENPRILRAPDTPPEVFRSMWTTIKSGRRWRGVLRNRKKSGEFFWEQTTISPILDAEGDIVNYIAVKEDITVRRAHEAKLERQAHYDLLTELPNRLLAKDRLQHALNGLVTSQDLLGVLHVDLAELTKVNDNLGFAVGDQVITESARRLQQCVRRGDTVACLGGDEFLVIMPELPTLVLAEITAQKILDSISEAYVCNDHEVFISARVGVTIAPDDADTPEQLMRNAHSAMFRAKEEGGNTYRFYTRSMNDLVHARRGMEAKLRHAIEDNEFSLAYQPQVDTMTGETVAVEALLRWHNEELGNISPAEFIPVAEEMGLIDSIGEWVLRRACHDIAQLSNRIDRDIRVAVNFSTHQFKGDSLVDTISSALKQSGLAPKMLEVEITEGVLIDNSAETRRILHGLSDIGVVLCLDDFGTGYSSLSYLKTFPFNTLKIDRAFITGVPEDISAATLASAIINLARNLGLSTICEGVEEKKQLEFLQEKKCDLIQGYYFSRPITLVELEDFLENPSPRLASTNTKLLSDAPATQTVQDTHA